MRFVFLESLYKFYYAVEVVAVIIIDIYPAAAVVTQSGHFGGERALHSADKVFKLYALLLFGFFLFRRKERFNHFLDRKSVV